MSSDNQSTPLTDFHREVASVFFGLPTSHGFLLAGGAGLIAHHLIARPTEDLDFFTSAGRGDVRNARDGFILAATACGWKIEALQDTPTFCRLRVMGAEELLVDLAVDAAPGRPEAVSILGPTFDPGELAGHKVLALFGRAAERDFVDVFALSRTFGKKQLLNLAAEVDPGFDQVIFTEMLDMLTSYPDVDLSLGNVDVSALRKFFAGWSEEIRGSCAPE